jgi:hypothetical protein
VARHLNEQRDHDNGRARHHDERSTDGTYSYAAHHQAACSHPGGVAPFYK